MFARLGLYTIPSTFSSKSQPPDHERQLLEKGNDGQQMQIADSLLSAQRQRKRLLFSNVLADAQIEIPNQTK